MKDKEKQIEEMGKDVCNNINTKMCADGTCPKHWDCPYSNTMAEILIEKGYQKVDKDKQVVLTKEEYDNLKLEIQKAHHKGVRVGFDLTKYKENSIEQARKETAREIIEMFSDKNYITEKDLIKAIAERYGVKIKND